MTQPRIIYYADAIREALRQEMLADDAVYIFGEDIAAYGGVFGVTIGLLEEFGPQRVRNTPLSEVAILGEAIGSAIYGLRPVPEIQFADFLTTAMSPLVDLAASYHYRIGTPIPMTVRAPSGGGLNIGNFHSKMLEAWFAHVPGLKIVVPSTAYDAKGLLIASIRDNNPVLFLEQKKLYREIRDEVPEASYTIPLGQGLIRREGSDVTVVTYGAPVYLALAVAEKLQEEISLEVIDCRSLVPLDLPLILSSVQKTNRVIILHEAPKTGGFGAELVAQLIESAFDDLAGPILRVAAKDMPIPTNPVLEAYYLPGPDDLIVAARRLMEY